MTYGQGDCHTCGGNNLDYESGEVQDSSYGYEFTCRDCGVNGMEWYKMEYDETIMIPK